MTFHRLNLWTAIPAWFMIAAICFACGCAGLGGRVTRDPFGFKTSGMTQYPETAAEAAYIRVRETNLQVKTIKGIGSFQYAGPEDRFASRLAWIGAMPADTPAQIRLEVLAPHGPPTVSLAADKKKIYFFAHADKQFYEKRRSDRVLEKYLHIPVSVTEMVAFLCGRLPVPEPDRMALTPDESGSGRILHLYHKKTGRVIALFMDEKAQVVSRMKCREVSGRLCFEAAFSRPETVASWQIPFEIAITDDKGSDFKLKMDRAWVNKKVDDAIFTLTRPD